MFVWAVIEICLDAKMLMGLDNSFKVVLLNGFPDKF